MAIDGNLIANFQISDITHRDSLLTSPIYFTLSGYVANVTLPGFFHQIYILNITVRQRNGDFFIGIVTVNQSVLIVELQIRHEVVVAFQGC